MDSRTFEKSRIFAITWITYAGFYFCRKNLSIVLPMLHGMPGMGNFELADIVFGYSLLYAIGQFGCGFLSDYFGPGKVVGTGLVLVVGSNIFMGLHASPLWLLAFACINGVGQSTGWSGLVKMMASLAQMQAASDPTATALAQSLQVSTQGSTVNVSVSLSEDQLQQIVKPKANVRRRAAR